MYIAKTNWVHQNCQLVISEQTTHDDLPENDTDDEYHYKNDYQSQKANGSYQAENIGRLGDLKKMLTMYTRLSICLSITVK